MSAANCIAILTGLSAFTGSPSSAAEEIGNPLAPVRRLDRLPGRRQHGLYRRRDPDARVKAGDERALYP